MVVTADARRLVKSLVEGRLIARLLESDDVVEMETAVKTALCAKLLGLDMVAVSPMLEEVITAGMLGVKPVDARLLADNLVDTLLVVNEC